MNEELDLFYKLWGKHPELETKPLQISFKKLGIFTQHDVRCFKSKWYIIWFFIIGMIINVLTAFTSIILLLGLAIMYRFDMPKAKKEEFAKIVAIYDGINAFNNQDYRKALNIFESIQHLIRNDDWEFNAWIYYCYMQLKEYDKAIMVIHKKGLMIGPRIKTLQTYFEAGNLQGMISTLKTQYFQIEIKHRPIMLAILGSVLLKQGYPDVAKKRLNVYKIQEHQLTPANCAYLYTLAKCEEALGNIQEAQNAYRTILAFSPQFMDVQELVHN